MAGAETVARSITDPDRQAQALAAVAEALVQAGQHEQAATAARSITEPGPAGTSAGGGGRGAGGEGGHETGASRGCGGVCHRTVDTVLGLVLSLEPSAVRVVQVPGTGHSR